MPPCALLAGLTLAALYLRTRVLTQSLWFDEILTVRVAQSSLTELYHNLLTYNTTHLPLYCLITRAFLVVCDSDWFSRMPAVLFGVAQVPVFWLMAKRIVDMPAAWVATFLLVISPIDVYYAQDARAYTMLGFGSLLALYGLLRALEDGSKWAWFCCFLGAMVSTQAAYFGFFALLALGIVFLLVVVGRVYTAPQSWREQVWPVFYFGLCCAGTGVAFIPCLPLVLELVHRDTASAAAQQLPAGLDWPFVSGQIVNLGWGIHAGFWLCLISLVTGVAHACFRRRALCQVTGAYVLAAYLPFLLMLLFKGKAETFQYRYILFVLPVFLLLIAEGLTLLTGLAAGSAARVSKLRWLEHLVTGAPLACILALVCCWPAIGGMFVALNENWRDTAQFVAAHAEPEDVTVIQPDYADYTLAYYGQGLPHVTPLKLNDADGLRRIAERGGRIWYIGKWGAKTPKMAAAMQELGFIGLYDAWAQGLILEMRDPGLGKDDLPKETVAWRARALAEVAWTPFMEVWMARAYRDAGDSDLAEDHYRNGIAGFRHALTVDPWNALHGVRAELDGLALARVLVETGDRDGARLAYREVLSLSPGNFPAVIELAPLELEAQNAEEALRLYMLQRKMDPNATPYLLLNIAKAYEQMGQVDRAFETLKALYVQLKASEGAPPYYWALGAGMLAHHGQVDRALAEFRTILQEKPDYPYTYFGFASALSAAGDLQQAFSMVNAGLAWDPMDANLLKLKEELTRAKNGEG